SSPPKISTSPETSSTGQSVFSFGVITFFNVLGQRPASSTDVGPQNRPIQRLLRDELKRNGYVLEQLYSPLVIHTTPEYEELKDMAFAATQWELFQKDDPSTGKAAALRIPGHSDGHPFDAHR